ncbi:MAG: hypothetical protein J5511_03180 [Bacilli bacterium]|nr:hypothetical protein [Bacilli bacterium]
MVLKEKILLSLGIVGLTGTFVVAGTQGILGVHNLSHESRASDNAYSLILNSSNAPEQLLSGYEDNITTVVETQLGNEIYLNIVNGKESSGNYVQLAPRGMIYNFKAATGQISGINSISVATTSGSVSLRASYFSLDGGAFLDDAVSLSNGTPYTLQSPAKYFQIIAGDNGAVVSSVTINYSCSEDYNGIAFAKGTYVGKGTKGNNQITYKMTIGDNGSTTIESLDEDTPETYSGTTTLTNDLKLSCAFTYGGNQIQYVTTISNNGQTLTPSSTGGFPSVTFYRVYNIDGFENYSGTGQGYTNSTTKYQTSGMRANYFSDYSVGSGGDSPIGGSNWHISTSSDFMNLSDAAHHSGSHCAVLKGSTNGIRFFSMNSIYGVNAAIGKGAVLSFWAHGAYTGSGLGTEATFDTSIKAYAFYNSKVTSSNFSQHDELEFTISAHSGWTEYKLPLDSNKTYYGFAFYTKPESTCYIPIDDISIYTYSPYLQPLEEDYPDGTYSATIIATGISSDANVWIMIAIGGRIGNVSISITDNSLTANSITYNSSNSQITISTSGGIKYGNSTRTVSSIVATYDKQNQQLKNVTFKNGNNNTSNITNNGSITMNFTSYYQGLNEDTTILRTMFKRRYNNGSWQTDTSHADRIVKDVVNYVGGAGAMKVRGWADGLTGISPTNDINLAGSAYHNIGFWVYNPSGSDITVRLFIYGGAGMTSAQEITSKTAKANSWVYCRVGFTSNASTIYNYQLTYQSATYLTFDNISLC